MVAYFAAMPTALYSVLCHKLQKHYDTDAVLFINSGAYATKIGNGEKNLLELTKQLKTYVFFKDIVACKMNIDLSDLTVEQAEISIIENYDRIFDNSGFKISDFKKIYTMNDDWEGLQNVYFNIKKIHYTWIQAIKNCIPPINGRSICFNKIMQKYNCIATNAEYAEVCLLDTSTEDQKFFDNKGKKYTVWSKDICFDNLTDNELHNLFKSFDLDEKILNTADPENSAIIIKNSYGFLSLHSYKFKKMNYVMGSSCYSNAEIYSVMDKVSADFYAPNEKHIFLKCHIHDPLNVEDVAELYGKNTAVFPNVPMEILGKFFSEKNIKFNKIIGTASGSLTAIKTKNYNKFYPLGEEFAKTWWFYISLYVSLLFAKKQGIKRIFCNNVLLSQLIVLSKEIDYTSEISIFDAKEAEKIKDSLIIDDMCNKLNIPLEKIDRTCGVIFLNYNLCDYTFSASSEMFATINIKKEMISDIACDILFREENLWIYSANKEIKKAARDFVFESNLNNLGMKIYSEKTTLPQTLAIFDSKQYEKENRKLKAVVEGQQSQIQLLTEYISAPYGIHKKLRSTTDIYEYLDILNIIKSKYLIVLAVRDTPGNCLSEEIIKKIFELGFTNFSKELWRMYVGISFKNLVIADLKGETNETPVEYQLHGDMLTLDVVSKAWRNGNQASVIINGKDYSVNMRGINIVVYDVNNSQLIDSIGFDRHTPNAKFVRI